MITTEKEGGSGRITAGGRDIIAICKADETVCNNIAYMKGEINKWLPGLTMVVLWLCNRSTTKDQPTTISIE